MYIFISPVVFYRFAKKLFATPTPTPKSTTPTLLNFFLDFHIFVSLVNCQTPKTATPLILQIFRFFFDLLLVLPIFSVYQKNFGHSPP